MWTLGIKAVWTYNMLKMYSGCDWKDLRKNRNRIQVCQFGAQNLEEGKVPILGFFHDKNEAGEVRKWARTLEIGGTTTKMTILKCREGSIWHAIPEISRCWGIPSLDCTSCQGGGDSFVQSRELDKVAFWMLHFSISCYRTHKFGKPTFQTYFRFDGWEEYLTFDHLQQKTEGWNEWIIW